MFPNPGPWKCSNVIPMIQATSDLLYLSGSTFIVVAKISYSPFLKPISYLALD